MNRVIRSEELPPATAEEPGIQRVTAGTSDVLVARLQDGEVLAFGTVCPHQLTDLREAYFFEGNLRCPRHQYIYDLHSGENIVPARDARPENLWKLTPGYLPVHRVEERDGWIWIAEDPEPPPPVYDPTKERRPADEGAPDPGRPTEAPAPEGPVEHPTKTLKVREGAYFELRLPTVPRPGFAWNVQVSAHLTIEEEEFLPSPQPRHRVRFLACIFGEASIRCAYARPWDTEPAEVRSYVVRIVAETGD